MATGTIEDLTVRAALDIAGVQRGTQEMVRELSRAKQEIEQGIGAATLPDMSDDARRQAEDLARTFSVSLSDGIEAEAARVSDAMEESLSGAAEAGARAVEESAATASAAMRELADSTEAVSPEPQIRDWQDWADAVRASNTAAREATDAQAELADAQRQVVTETRLSAEEIERLEADFAARQAARRGGQAAQSAAAARDEAIARGQALLRQLQNDEARIKLAQMDQLLNPREAAEAARISAEAYNRELRRVIAQGEAAGAFTGRQGQESFTQLAGTIRRLDTEARRSTGGLGRLNDSMVTVARQAAGAHPAVGRLVDVVGTFAIGTGAMVGVLAGLAAIAAAYRKITEDSREAKRAQEEAVEVIERLEGRRRTESFGPGAEAAEATAELVRQQEQRARELEELDRRIDQALAAQDETQAQIAASLIQRRERTQEEYDRIAAVIEEGEAEVRRRVERAAQDMRRQEASNLAALVASNNATADEYARARQIIADEMTRFVQLGQLGELSLAPAIVGERAAILSMVEQLTRALEGPARSINQTNDAAERLEETLREIAVTSALGAVDMGELPENIRDAYQNSERLRDRLRNIERTLADVRRAGGQVPEEATAAVEELRRAIEQADVELEGLVRRLGMDRPSVVTLPVSIGGVEIQNPEEVQRLYEEQVRERLEQEAVRMRLNLDLQPTRSFAERNGIVDRDEAVANAREATQAFNENVEAGRELLSAFGDLAETSARLDEAFSRTLRGLETFTQGVQRIRFGQALAAQGEGFLGGLAQFSGMVSAFAGATSIIRDFIDSGRERAREEQRAADALARFRLQLEGFRVTPDILRGVYQGVEEAVRRLPVSEFSNVITRGAFNDRALNRGNIDPILAEMGITFSELQAAAEELGITILTASGRIDPDAFEELAVRAREAARAVTGFRNTLDDRQLERGLRDRILGIERTSQQQIDSLFGDLSALSGELFSRYFSDIDFSDVESVRAAVLQAYEDFAAGVDGFSEMMGDMTREEWLEWVGLVADHLSEMDRAVQEVTSTFRGVPEIFNYTLASIRAAGTREYVPPSQQQTPAPNFVPPPTDPRDTGPGGSTVGVRVEPGAVVVDASSTFDIGESVTRSLTEAVIQGLRQGGVSVTPQMVEQIRRDLKVSLERAAAGEGGESRALARAWPAR